METNIKLLAQIESKYETQIAFSEAIGRHRVTVSGVVNGQRNLDDEEQAQWAEALGCTVESIF